MRNRFLPALILFSGLIAYNSGNVFARSGKEKHGSKHTFTVTGDVANMPQTTIVLEMLRANDSIKAVDSQRSDASGHFEFSGKLSEPGLYRLQFSPEKFILLSLNKGTTKLSSSWPITDYTITGSTPSVELKSFVDSVVAYMQLMNQSAKKIDSFKANGDAAGAHNEEAGRMAVNEQLRAVVKRNSMATKYEPNAIISTRILNPQEDEKFYETFDKSIDSRFPGTVMTKEFHQFMKLMKDALPAPTEIGDKAPDLTLSDTSGKAVTLSSLRGKYVLLDFWASWCGPCRAENPNVLAAYKQFKDQNFTIMAVSLDNNKDRWLDAVHHDALMWRQVSDLKGWQSPAAAKYSVRSIPSNFLIDPSGTIIAKNLRGPMLDAKLGEVLKK